MRVLCAVVINSTTISACVFEVDRKANRSHVRVAEHFITSHHCIPFEHLYRSSLQNSPKRNKRYRRSFPTFLVRDQRLAMRFSCALTATIIALVIGCASGDGASAPFAHTSRWILTTSRGAYRQLKTANTDVNNANPNGNRCVTVG